MKKYKVLITRYPVEIEVFAASIKDARMKAKEQVNFSVWESEVEEII